MVENLENKSFTGFLKILADFYQAFCMSTLDNVHLNVVTPFKKINSNLKKKDFLNLFNIQFVIFFMIISFNF